MKLTIVEYPDRRLKLKSDLIKLFDKNLHKLLDAMNEMMMSSNGIGLAAIQVNHPKQVLILNIPLEDGEQVQENLLEIINPILITKDGETTYQEGCLSVPSFYEDIKRYENITIKYQDRYGKEHTLEATGLLSIAIQHEIDHLNGILFIDKLSYSRRKKFEKEYKQFQKDKKRKKK
ncbi:MAG: peptide deformylase [Epsilonproteobacteria bacterium]|nr:peptide deformylase [Campylobacterota bacterium]